MGMQVENRARVLEAGKDDGLLRLKSVRLERELAWRIQGQAKQVLGPLLLMPEEDVDPN